MVAFECALEHIEGKYFQYIDRINSSFTAQVVIVTHAKRECAVTIIAIVGAFDRW